MTPSIEQNDFFHALVETEDNLMLEAVAGSGKTTTIVMATRLLPESKSVKFLAFNKNIARELEERLPKTVSVKTFHSEGYAILRRQVKKIRLDEDKTAKLLKELVEYSKFGIYISSVKKIVSLAKNSGLTEASPNEDFFALLTHFQIDASDIDEDQAVALSKQILSKSQDPTVIDFDDMLWLPWILNYPFDRSNFVFIDEAQDTNYIQRALLRRIVAERPYGRLIAVGDSYQAIYGFRGADANAMTVLKNEFGMKSLPLSVSYRCAKAIVEEARKYLL